MLKSVSIKILTLIAITTLVLSACGGQRTAEDPSIQTAIAMTVAAQNAQPITFTETPSGPTPFPTKTPYQTPLQFSPTLTPLAPVASPTIPTSSAKGSECAKASLISETIPDGTIFKPGEQFTKTWEIKNLSNCTWDTSYKIIFWNGDVLGGGYVYNLPQATPPQATVPISLVLTAPKTDGTYNSEWKLQTPDGTSFGVGQYDASFYTQIVVTSSDKPAYGVTSVEYSVTREPSGGCPANVMYTVYATITTNGPVEVSYSWIQSDGNNSKPKTLEFKAAGSQTLARQWQLHLGSTPNERWIALVVHEPVYKEYKPGQSFFYTCQ